MSFLNRLTKIILYVVAAISIVVVLFFYAGPRTLDYDELETRVEEILNPVDMEMPGSVPEVDTTSQDTAAMEGMAVDTAAADTAAMAGAPDEEDEGESVFGTADVLDTSGVNLGEHLSTWEYLVYFRTDIALMWAYILLVLTAVASLLFPLITVFSNPRALVRLVGVLVGAGVLVVISYLLSSDAPINIIGYTGTANSDPSTLKFVDTTLYVVYMLFGLAILSILYSIVSRVFK